MRTRCRYGRIGGTFALTFALISLVGLGGSIWLVFKNRDIVIQYKPATCSFKAVKESGWTMCHYCITAYVTSIRNGKKASVSRLRCKVSRFPCVLVEVSYYDEAGKSRHGIIQDHSSINKFFKECSFSSCYSDPEENKKEIDDFVRRWREIPSRKCSYDPKDTRRVITTSNLMYTLAVQGIIWSSLVFIGCVTFIVCCCIYRHVKLKRRMEEDTKVCTCQNMARGPWVMKESEEHETEIVTEITTRVQLRQNGCHRSNREHLVTRNEEVVPLSDMNESPWKRLSTADLSL